MADDEDLYAALGIDPSADAERIREAWRTIARAHHPDRNDDDVDEVRFRRASAAWSVLKDPDRRLVYDRFGIDAATSHMAPEMARTVRSAEGMPDPEPEPDPESEPDLDPPPPPPPPRPAPRQRAAHHTGAPGARMIEVARGARPAIRTGDARADLVLSLEEAAIGGPRDVEVDVPAPCHHCDGTGIRASGRSCGACRGMGMGTTRRTVSVPVPVSVASGVTVKVKGGVVLSDGGHGDLHVTITVKPHDHLRRHAHGLDLETDLALRPDQVHDGGDYEVEALDGRATVRLTAATPFGKRVRVAGRGMPGPQGRPPGDLFVIIRRR